MNVAELLGFTRWVDEHVVSAKEKFDALASVLSHNASQPDKQPVVDPLNDLLQVLTSLPLEQLTLEQEGLLEHLKVAGFLGRNGHTYVDSTVRAGDYDPATAASEITTARDAIAHAIKQMERVRTSMEALEFVDEIDVPVAEGITLRLQFKGDASISNVVELRDWSNDWYDIIRGVALYVDEAPEQTQVIGATNGSLIVVLAGTYGVVTLLALIAKHVSYIIKEGLDIAGVMEDLKQKKLLSKVIEEELKSKQVENEQNGVHKIIDAIKEELPDDVDGEKETALKRSIEKYLDFNKRGGELDFIAPPEEDEGEKAGEALQTEKIAEIRRIVEEIRTTRAELMMLSHQDANEDDGDDEDDEDDEEE